LPDVLIADFYLFGQLKQQLSGRTSDSEPNVLETAIEILNEVPKGEVKSTFCFGRTYINESQTIMECSILAIQMPRYFDVVSFDLQGDI
jgi:hypothetical protein